MEKKSLPIEMIRMNATRVFMLGGAALEVVLSLQTFEENTHSAISDPPKSSRSSLPVSF